MRAENVGWGSPLQVPRETPKIKLNHQADGRHESFCKRRQSFVSPV